MLFTLARHVAATARSARALQSAEHHGVAPDAYGPLDLTIVALGVVVVIVTTIYSLVYLVRPGEAGADHIKRRILEEGREGSQ